MLILKLRLYLTLLIPGVWVSFPTQNRLLANQIEYYRYSVTSAIAEIIDAKNATSITQIAEFQLRNDVNEFIFTPTADLIITTSSNAQLLNLGNNTPHFSFISDCRPISEVAVSPDGTKVAVVESDHGL